MGTELGLPDIEISGDESDDYFIFIQDYEDYGLSEIAEEFASTYLGLSKPSANKTTFYKLGSDCSEKDIILNPDEDVDWRSEVYETIFENSEYKVVVVDKEISVGASSGYEQIFLSILNGATAGAVAYFIDKSLKMYGNKKAVSSENERTELIFSFLKNRYGINGDLLIIDSRKNNDEWYYKIEDVSKDIVFELFLNDLNGVRLIRIKK